MLHNAAYLRWEVDLNGLDANILWAGRHVEAVRNVYAGLKSSWRGDTAERDIMRYSVISQSVRGTLYHNMGAARGTKGTEDNINLVRRGATKRTRNFF
jgi:hypothetical protein